MRHVLSVFVENQTGVLVRVVSMFSRREFNIDSLAVGETENSAYSRITIVVRGSGETIEQMIKQLEKMPVVHAVARLDEKAAVCRGMTLIKVKADDTTRLDSRTLPCPCHRRGSWNTRLRNHRRRRQGDSIFKTADTLWHRRSHTHGSYCA